MIIIILIFEINFKKEQIIMNKLLKDYQNMDSFQLEKHIQNILDAKIIKNEKQIQEMKKLFEELRKQNFVKLIKNEIFKK